MTSKPFFGLKGLKEENIVTKAQLSITFISNELFFCKRFFNNLDCKYGEKEIFREFVDTLRTRINYDFLLDGDISSNLYYYFLFFSLIQKLFKQKQKYM